MLCATTTHTHISREKDSMTERNWLGLSKLLALYQTGHLNEIISNEAYNDGNIASYHMSYQC
jgi:hypothetical protein